MKNSYHKNIIILAILFLLGIILIILSSINKDINLRSYEEIIPYFNAENGNKDIIISDEFTSTQNYLGGLSIRLKSFSKDIKDRVLFRIKEKNSNIWYYEGSYNTIQFQTLPLFPFGFPVITDSKNKKYIYQLIYKNNKKKLIQLSEQEPNIIVKYQIPKAVILRNSSLIGSFIKNKIAYILHSYSYSSSIFFYEFPFFIFAAFLFIKNNATLRKVSYYLNTNIPLQFRILFFFICIESSIPFYTDITKFICILVWLFYTKKHVIKYQYNFILILSISFVSMIAFFMTAQNTAYNLVTWCYYFLVITTIQGFIAIFKYDKKK